MRIAKLLTLVVFLAFGGSLRADEIFLVKKGRVAGKITAESGLGVVLEGKKIIPAGDIVDIRYDKKKDDPSNEPYYATRFKEASLEKAKDRRSDMLELIKLYESTLKEMPKDAELDRVRRHVEFRIAFLRGRMAVEFGVSPATAIAALKDFKNKHPNSWQISHGLRMLAEVQKSENKLADAEKTYAELAGAQVAEEIKQEAEFQVAKVTMQSGNFAQALTKFRDLGEKLPKGSLLSVRAAVGQAECLSLSGNTEEGNQLLRQLLKDSPDRNLQAYAHNALGKNFFDGKQYKEARWEFLWVDVVYNQDQSEHAKALYYLWKTFAELRELDRAADCLSALLSEPFAGTEYQRKAKTETKK